VLGRHVDFARASYLEDADELLFVDHSDQPRPAAKADDVLIA